MTREKRCEVFRYADGAHAGAAATVGNAKRFVKIEMTDVGSDMARRGEADLRIHIRAIHVDLATVGMNCVADVFDRGFEYAVRGRIGDHQRGEIVAVRFCFGFEITDVDIAVFIAGHGHDFQTAHGGTGGIGAVRAGGDQTNISNGIAT